MTSRWFLHHFQPTKKYRSYAVADIHITTIFWPATEVQHLAAVDMPLHRGKTFWIHIFCSNWLRHQRQQTFEAPHPYEGAERYDDLTNSLPGRETRHILLVVNVDIHHTKERQQETKLPYFLKMSGNRTRIWLGSTAHHSKAEQNLFGAQEPDASHKEA